MIAHQTMISVLHKHGWLREITKCRSATTAVFPSRARALGGHAGTAWRHSSRRRVRRHRHHHPLRNSNATNALPPNTAFAAPQGLEPLGHRLIALPSTIMTSRSRRAGAIGRQAASGYTAQPRTTLR